MALRSLFSIQFEHAAGKPLFEDQPDVSSLPVKAWQVAEAVETDGLPEALLDSAIESEDQKPESLRTACQPQDFASLSSSLPEEEEEKLEGRSFERIQREAEEKAKEYLRREYGLEDLDLSLDRFQKPFDQMSFPDQQVNPARKSGEIHFEAALPRMERMEIKVSSEMPAQPDPQQDFDFDQELDFDLFEGEIDFDPE